MELSNELKERDLYPTLLMGAVALLVTALLMLSFNATEAPIAARQKEDLTRQLDQVLPSSLYDNEPLDQEFSLSDNGTDYKFYRARNEGAVSAIILFTQSAGYSGDVHLLVAIKADGSLGGVRVLSHTETPGLGDKVELAKSDWILGFTGLSLQNPDDAGWHVKKDGGQFDAFTGATITPRAVVKGVHEALQLFERHKAEFLEGAATPAAPAAQTPAPASTEQSLSPSSSAASATAADESEAL